MSVTLRFINTGYCIHPERVIIPNSRRPLFSVRSPSSVGLIEHSKEGIILFDSGYSTRNYKVTRHFPEKLYALLLPMTISKESSALAQLKQFGYRAQDVSHVVLSHFHADHIGGLSDFSTAKFKYVREAYETLKQLNRWDALKRGFLPSLLPETFQVNSEPLDTEGLQPYDNPIPGFEKGWDLFGDQKIIAIPLDGHAIGHIGLLVRADRGEKFLIGDAAWTTRSVDENLMPSRVTRLIMSNFNDYRTTLGKLHALRKLRNDLEIIPCHCEIYHQ